eukprot:CAMPEP_0182424014 /NCGR_PEP_ID=MMETSP1167-20130531/10141_1 /TAXON_ID=2988 /ORGANISM="Mallomonas Sp, Strain CCMP3275" /LENGTH=241 /DNA_ID=CAMNT_0024603483 /DNA_START=339 /DNA_END=1064 /DNA_ORIENTATION=-
MAGPLDFGIPALYTGRKKFVDGTAELNKICENIDFVLLSQGLDDHAHTPTLKALSRLRPDMKYLAPPSAESVLKSCGVSIGNVDFLSPGQSKSISKESKKIEITATAGALVGPPWQPTENGYIIKSLNPSSSTSSLYYEPHCMYDASELSRFQVDCVITPVVAQELPYFTLVAGGNKALQLGKILGTKVIVPMTNGELEQSGALASLVRSDGSVDEFKQLVKDSGENIRVVDAPPGQVIRV